MKFDVVTGQRTSEILFRRKVCRQYDQTNSAGHPAIANPDFVL